MDTVRVLTLTNMYPTREEPWFGSFVQEQVEDLRTVGINVRVLAFDGRADRRAYGSAARALRRLVVTESFDLVHAHYGLTGAVALSQRRLPVITTFHGSDTGYIRWQRRVSWWVARLTTPIFVSRQNAESLGLGAARVIPCGISLRAFEPEERAVARQTLGWPNDRPTVLLPGARSKVLKRADMFDAAVSAAREMIPELHAVALEGFSREQVRSVFAATDVTLMTSDWEGSPVAVKESLAMGTPVVSVEVGDVPEILRGLPGCSIQPRNPTALAQGVIEALKVRRPSELRARAAEYEGLIIAERIADVYQNVTRGAK